MSIHGHSQLPAFAWPGGYPLAYLVRTAVRFRSGRLVRIDERLACPHCARLVSGQRYGMEPSDTLESIRPDVYWEGPPLECELQFEGCAEHIESAYGEPDEH